MFKVDSEALQTPAPKAEIETATAELKTRAQTNLAAVSLAIGQLSRITGQAT